MGANPACFQTRFRDDDSMSVSYKLNGPVTLTEGQIMALHNQLRDMRHDVNGRMANIVAAAELVRLRPDRAEERLRILLDQPHQAAEAITIFSRAFETAFGLVRPPED
jgi:hypothetical protein